MCISVLLQGLLIGLGPDMHAVPMQFEPLELHVIDALGTTRGS